MNRRLERFRSIGAVTAGPLAAVVLATVLLGFLASPSSAQEEAETTDAVAVDEAVAAEDELLREGAAVYSQICSACHQPGGIGIEGSFPPLIDNPNIAGPDGGDYLREVINNGRQGEIIVNGQTYNGVMPSFSTLADDDVDAVVFYIQSGFQAPSAAAVDLPTVGPVAGTELPALADMGWIAAFLVAALVALLVVGPRLTSQNSRLNTPWFDVWLKTATIFVAVALAIAFIPNWVLQTSTVSSLDRPLQDLIGVSVWGLGLLLCLGGLWYAHKDSRI